MEQDNTNLCPGSGKPTRSIHPHGCDRCAATNVRGKYVRVDPTEGSKKFVGFPSFGYWQALPHEAVPYARS